MLLIGTTDIFQVQGQAAGLTLLFSLLKDTLRRSPEEQGCWGSRTPARVLMASQAQGLGRGDARLCMPAAPTEAFYETFPRWPTASIHDFTANRGK